MPEISVSTLHDLTVDYRLYSVCNACQRMAKLSLLPLLNMLGAAFPIKRIKHKLRCQSCSSSDSVVLGTFQHSAYVSVYGVGGGAI